MPWSGLGSEQTAAGREGGGHLLQIVTHWYRGQAELGQLRQLTTDRLQLGLGWRKGCRSVKANAVDLRSLVPLQQSSREIAKGLAQRTGLNRGIGPTGCDGRR